MGEASGILEKERALTHSGDLIDCLRNESDSILWKQCLEQFKLLESKSDADFEFSESSVQGKVLAFLIFSWLGFVVFMFICFAIG